VLKVEGEARDGAPTPPPGQDSLPDLSDALFFLLKLEGFKGCLRGLAINQQSQNLSGHKVGQCFPLVEQGSYFPGDAYAVYKEKFHVGSLLELQLEFRTSENTGVLLSVSEPEGYPALSLELNNGKGAPSGTLGTRDNFKGCIRNVVIGGELKDWTDMASLNNILLSSCPCSPIEDHLMAQLYLRFLQEKLPNLLEYVPLETR
ncbi:hypothetical protein C0J52_27895, partial [Blattella germanica]